MASDLFRMRPAKRLSKISKNTSPSLQFWQLSFREKHSLYKSHSLGALLAQRNDEGFEQAIYYLSRTLIGVKSHYYPVEKECLTLICAIQKTRHYLVRQVIHVISRLNVMPRSHGYGDITATYICRVEIPSHIYIKHKYMQELEYRSTVVIYIPAVTHVHSYHRALYNIPRILDH